MPPRSLGSSKKKTPVGGQSRGLPSHDRSDALQTQRPRCERNTRVGAVQQPLRRRGPKSSNAVAQFFRTPNVTEQAHLPKDGAVVFQSPMRAGGADS